MGDKGMEDSQKVTFSGEGDQEPGLEPGDIIIVLDEKAHTLFKRNGSDLVMKIDISLTEALTGMRKTIKTLDDRTLVIQTVSGEVIKTGDLKQVQGEGMPQYRPRPTPPPPPRQPIPQRDDDIQEIMPVVKSEPSHLVEAPIQPLAQQDLPMYDERSQQVESNIMMSMDTEQYDDSYGDYEGQYGDNGQGYEGDMGGVGQEGVGTDCGGKTQCGFCYKLIHPSSLKRHIRNQHGDSVGSQVVCDVCNKIYKNEATMKEHKRITHNIYQRANL